jgi:hypothetical protein
MPEAQPGIMRIAVEGERVAPGKLPLRDLRRIGELAQQGIERIARVLIGEPGYAPGPLPETVREATELLVVGVEQGSAVAVIELNPPPEDEVEVDRLMPLPVRDLGLRAMDHFVEGLHQLEVSTDGSIPEGWDISVVEVAEKLAEAASERRLRVTFKAKSPTTSEKVAHIGPEAIDLFRVRHATVRRRRSAQGELVAIDLEKGRLDVKGSKGPRIQCQFGPELLDQARHLVGETVLVSGEEEVDLASNKSGRLEVDTLKLSTQQVLPYEAFWLNRSAAEQAAEQGTRPLGHIAELASEDFSEEDINGFLEAMAELRSAEQQK